jgi:hypothetical protein
MESERILHSSLMQRLQTVRDYRGGRKPQYPLWLMLLLALLGVMSGCYGYKALEEFGIRHYQQLCELLELKLERMPSDTTIRRMFGKVKYEQLTQIFNAWAGEEFEPEAGEWLAVDGKSIKGTVQNNWDAFQNFVSVVSVYSPTQRVVIAQKSFENKVQSEIQVVEQLLTQLGLTRVVVSMDALHCQKKRWRA